MPVLVVTAHPELRIALGGFVAAPRDQVEELVRAVNRVDATGIRVGVLESAGLIDRDVRGREHWLSVRSDGLRRAEEWITDQVSFWSARADALAARLERRRRQP